MLRQLLAITCVLATPACGQDILANIRVDQVLGAERQHSPGSDERGLCILDMYDRITTADEAEKWYVTDDLASNSLIFNRPEDGRYVVCGPDARISLDIGLDDNPSKISLDDNPSKITMPY